MLRIWSVVAALLAATAEAQDFVPPKMMGDEEEPARPKKPPANKHGKKGDEEEEPPENGLQDDGETVEYDADGKRVRRKRPVDVLTGEEAAPPENPVYARSSSSRGTGATSSSSAGAPVGSPDAGVPQAGSSSGAAHPPPPPPPLLAGTASSALERAKASFVVTHDGYASLLAAWDARLQEATPAGKQKALLVVLATAARIGGGVPGGAQALDIGLALTDEAHTLVDALELERAQVIADAAIQLAPSVPATHLALARVRWTRSPTDVGPILSAVGDAAAAEIKDVRSALRWVFGLGVSLSASIVVLLLGMAFLAGGRRLRLLLHDVAHLFPLALRGPVTTVITAAALLLPLVTGAGIFLCALWWLTCAWLYLDTVERVVAVVAAVMSAAVPTVAEYVAPVLLFPSSVTHTAYLGTLDLARAEVLLPRLEKAGKDALSLGAAGVLHKRLGNLEAARDNLESALRQDPRAAWLHVNLGAVLASQGLMERAQMEFERAVEIGGLEVLALHNSASLHNMMNRIAAARDAWDSAEKTDHALAQGYRDRSQAAQPRPHNVAFLDAPPPVARILAAALERTPASDGVADDMWRRACPWVPRGLYPLAVLLFLVAWVLMAVGAMRAGVARECRRCGGPACRRCDGKDVDAWHCGQCYNAFIARGARVETALKIRKDLEVRRFKLRRRLLGRGLSFVLAGGGQLWTGMTVVGAVLLWMFAMGLGAAVVAGAMVPDPFGVGHSVSWLRALVAAGPVVLVWLASVVVALRSDV